MAAVCSGYSAGTYYFVGDDFVTYAYTGPLTFEPGERCTLPAGVVAVE
jgi:hypothetical protein